MKAMIVDSLRKPLVEVATERLEADIKSLAAHISAATCRWLLMLAEYDRRKGYEQWECVSIEQWLSVHTGLASSTARAHVAVGRDLAALPKITEAFGEGRLSYSKVRALCRVASPDNEADWLSLGLHASASQLERLTGDVRRVLIAAQHGTAARQLDERSLTWSWTDNGMMRLAAVLPPDTGARLATLLRDETETARRDEHSNDRV